MDTMNTITAVAKKLGLSYATVYHLIKTGRIAHHRFGKSYRVSDSQLARYVAETLVEPEDPTGHGRCEPTDDDRAV